MWNHRLALCLLATLMGSAMANPNDRDIRNKMMGKMIKLLSIAAAKAQVLNMDLLTVTKKLKEDLKEQEGMGESVPEKRTLRYAGNKHKPPIGRKYVPKASEDKKKNNMKSHSKTALNKKILPRAPQKKKTTPK